MKIDRYRGWLGELGILDRPWLILGSAPSPTLPAGVLADHARVDINNSGRTAEEMGLGRADLTFRAKAKPWSEHPNLDTHGLLWIHTKPRWYAKLKLRYRPHRHIESLEVLTPKVRERIVMAETALPVSEIGDLGKVTNGIAAACFGLACGVPSIVLAGISLTSGGHSYNQNNRARMQITEDRAVLKALAKRNDISTTEAELAEETGLTLFRC
ncbi:MAG: hypothetical protein KAG89_11070 [Fulvimarina manganoxydans]|uniref:hypothetical protein n=1 Tax=Fulvimarina manganoxydans TaxID=937218 RepID=UPI002357FF80|nr:hypothetical protein [Fulvimarina manganoxydans]MCK5932700.1 hypothetical protein [Fulvimarina manganoxydans]